MKDDVTELIINALLGVCTECKGRGWTRKSPKMYECFGAPPFDSNVLNSVDMCEACNGTGEA
mgnify:CR=1 FL=1